MKTTSLSVAIATFNEAANIDRCLKALTGWVDEIIIVDGQSTDNTIDLAKKYPQVKTISTTNKPFFHINKQIAIDKAKGDWILQLDADEVVSPKLKEEILSVIGDPQISENGFWINRRNFFLDRFLTKGGQYPDATLRLYRRGFGRLPCRSVHEQAEVDGKVGHLQNDLLHYADPDFDRYLTRNNRYTSLMAQELAAAKLPLNAQTFLNYFLIKPITTFFSIYCRHRGFQDGFPGFIFAYYSAISFQSAYVKYYGQKQKIKNRY